MKLFKRCQLRLLVELACFSGSFVSACHELLRIKNTNGDGFGVTVWQMIPAIHIAIKNGWRVICDPENFEPDSHNLESWNRRSELGHLFGCRANNSTRDWVPLSALDSDRIKINLMRVTVEDPSGPLLETLAVLPLEEYLPCKQNETVVHVYDRHSLGNGAQMPYDVMFSKRIELRLGIDFLRMQYHLASNDQSAELNRIWSGKTHRIAVHIRRGDIRKAQRALVRKVTKSEEFVVLRSDSTMHHADPRYIPTEEFINALLSYLPTVDLDDCAVAIISETSLDLDPEIRQAIHHLRKEAPGLVVNLLLGEPETDQTLAVSRLARDLKVLATSTVLIMSDGHFSLLGAALQNKTHLKILPFQEQVHSSANILKHLGWNVQYSSSTVMRRTSVGFDGRLTELRSA